MIKILFPTDFSNAAENAFFYALQLTRKLNAELVLAHVYNLPELGRALHNTSKEVFEIMEMETLENFKKSVETLRRKAENNGYGDIEFKHIMAEGQIVSRIVDLARKEEANYIVMGTTGATGLKEVFLGSVAAGVIDNSPCNVLSIPEEVSPTNSIDKIAYLTNYKDEEVVSFNTVNKFAEYFDADVCSIHYQKEVTDISKENMENWKKKLGVDYEKLKSYVVTGNNFDEAICELYMKQNIDILAIQPRKRNFFTQLFKRSVSKQIVQRLSIPLFTLPAK
ncbi:universal stress protein [Brumimicrobium glaciale]|jgi:nucleotide-binding universal stress UspA family protein|uniref:Universal stress protein n=1 Tax=Brumimicrobium glaciale TaxID=200475 RepID=A0A4Q4KQN7_9FLAO|nr:universal stress protein [Brumimicrobium glaciale]RYM35493.1 universal stress protein [Brumimicrobium glaciale]